MKKEEQISSAFRQAKRDTGADVESASVSIRLTVVNGSSKVVAAGGKWAVKDEDTETVAEATFGRILAGASQLRTVALPTGAEWGLFNFKAEDGSGTWAGPHGGDNNEAYRLTLGDN
ncbi:hypothetical protein [Halomonas litopenaei]|uniref:hypothetical protein n=1 Tax=Halomonas litopenaei TaxID=2109328 RepID=UPI003FA142AA